MVLLAGVFLRLFCFLGSVCGFSSVEFFARQASTGCREAPPARRKGGPAGLRPVLSRFRAPRLKSEIVQTHVLRLNKISLARGQRMFLARMAHAECRAAPVDASGSASERSERCVSPPGGGVGRPSLRDGCVGKGARIKTVGRRNMVVRGGFCPRASCR